MVYRSDSKWKAISKWLQNPIATHQYPNWGCQKRTRINKVWLVLCRIMFIDCSNVYKTSYEIFKNIFPYVVNSNVIVLHDNHWPHYTNTCTILSDLTCVCPRIFSTVWEMNTTLPAPVTISRTCSKSWKHNIELPKWIQYNGVQDYITNNSIFNRSCNEIYYKVSRIGKGEKRESKQT